MGTKVCLVGGRTGGQTAGDMTGLAVLGGVALALTGAPLLADPALLEGDAGFGAYLSAECVACHGAGADAAGIPRSAGLERAMFVAAMLDYRTKARPHPIMQTIAARLTDPEIAALAAYFETAGDRSGQGKMR